MPDQPTAGSFRRTAPVMLLVALSLSGCRAEVWVESPDERTAARPDSSVADTAASVGQAYRPAPIDSAGASFAWVVERPAPLLPTSRSFPGSAVEAARQFLRALAQTGSGSHGLVGVGAAGYDRAFTYVHPVVRRGRTAADWAPSLAGIVRPAVIRLEPVPSDSTLVFAEIEVLRAIDGQSLLGLYYGHFSARPGDNGWQLTGGRLMSEDWESPLGGQQLWRYDRAGAAQAYAAEDPAYALDLVELKSGEWVPVTRPTPVADLTLGLPDLR